MLKIGLTGGIGSGKSLVADIFRILGIPVYNADERARQLLNTSTSIKTALSNRYGADIYNSNGIDREKLAAIIFQDHKELDFVNSVVHPVVKENFFSWANNQKEVPYVIEEAAILFESGAYKTMDYTIAVTAPKELRINRVVKRDRVKKEQVLSRIQHQLPEEESISRADFVMINDEKELIVPQVIAIDKKLRTIWENLGSG